MPPPNSSATDDALTLKLMSDATLMGLLPDGVFFDQAKPTATRFVIIALLSSEDEAVFGGRAIEDGLYLVKAVVFGTDSVVAKAAAARIDVLLEDQPLTAAGYTWMTTHREERVAYVEVDDVDKTIRWQHRGGHYRVQMSVTGM